MSTLHVQLLCDILLDIVMVCIYLCNINAFVSYLYIRAIHSYKNMWIALVVCLVSSRVMLRVMEEFVNWTNHNR